MTASAEVRLAKAQELLANAQVYEAIRELETLIQERPDHFQAYVHLGFIHFKLAAIAKGRECMQKALALAPSEEDKNKILLILKEQDKLDKGRYYRPDFDALRKKKQP
jgi:Tfp pilus assembly protein PilF